MDAKTMSLLQECYDLLGDVGVRLWNATDENGFHPSTADRYHPISYVNDALGMIDKALKIDK